LSRIRVLEVMEATGGGTKKHLYQLAANLDRDSFDISVACPSMRHPSYGDESVVAELQVADIRIHIVEMRRAIDPTSDLGALRKLSTLMRREAFDVVHTHSSKGGFLGRLAARLAGARAIVHTAHGLFFLGQEGASRKFYLALERLAARWTDQFIAVSASEKAAAIAHGLFRAERIVVIENGIEMPPASLAIDVAQGRRELGLDPSRPVVGTVSRFNPQKDPFTLVRAVAHMNRAAHEVQFVWCGDGQLKPQAKSLARDLGVRNSIVFVEYCQDVLRLMALLDVFVASSLFEGLPYTLLEVMSMGKPVVATDVTGTRDVVVHGRTGLLVPAQDPSALSRAVLDLVHAPERARCMGQAGQDLVARRFTLNKMIGATEQVYRQLAWRSS
jgi:glycosyltransferase involved in cell wall biosynthesis